MVTAQDVIDLFAKMTNAGWDMNKPYVWGYFFKDTSKEKLNTLAIKLNSLGYEINDINQSFPDEIFWLHIEKTEQHTIDTLNQANFKFNQMASAYHIMAYDGMDISPKE